MFGEHVSRILRPEVNTSTVSSSWSAEQDAVAARRLTEPVDLLAQRQQLLAGLLEGVHQLGVARRERVDPGLQLVDVSRAAETARRAHRVLELLAQHRRLASKFLQLGSFVTGHRCPVGFRTL